MVLAVIYVNSTSSRSRIPASTCSSTFNQYGIMHWHRSMYKRRYLRFQSHDARRHRLLVYVMLGLSLTLLSYHVVIGRFRGEVRSHVARPVYREKELVFAATSMSDMGWVKDELGPWWANIYRTDDPEANLTVPVNKGNEAMVYLTYMIDRYSSLPDVTVFLHDARYQWHNDNPSNDAVISVTDLDLNFIKSTGYANLRCTWAIGCPSELEPARYLRERPDDTDHPTAMEFPDGFVDLFPGSKVPDIVATPCCSQFAVSRKRIRDRPIEDYIRYRDWLLNTTLPTDVSGRILEYSWHMIFGKPAQYCVDPRTCYCQTYSYCNMTDEDLGNQWAWYGLNWFEEPIFVDE